MKILAGIVLYNPDIERLQENLNAISGQVDKVLLIDNGSSDISRIKFVSNNDNYSIVSNKENMGIAHALNQILHYCIQNDYDWFLTLDQDSVANRYLVKNYSSFLRTHPEINCGCITSNIIDRNFEREEKYSDDCDFKIINYCITSGSMMNAKIIHSIGGFDDRMFIDKVDTEICIRIVNNGYQIIRINYDGVLHEIGHAKQISLVFRTWDLYNHPPIRRYYMCRNAVYLMKKYHSRYTLKVLMGEILQTVLVLIHEDEKRKKIAFSFHGYKDGVQGRMGSIPKTYLENN